MENSFHDLLLAAIMILHYVNAISRKKFSWSSKKIVKSIKFAVLENFALHGSKEVNYTVQRVYIWTVSEKGEQYALSLEQE